MVTKLSSLRAIAIRNIALMKLEIVRRHTQNLNRSTDDFGRNPRRPCPRKLANPRIHPIPLLHPLRNPPATPPHPLDILHFRAYPPKTRRICCRPVKRRSTMATIPIPRNTNTILHPFPGSATRTRTLSMVETRIQDTV